MGQVVKQNFKALGPLCLGSPGTVGIGMESPTEHF